MKLQCKHCPEEFVSFDLRPDIGLKECGDNLIAHVMKLHRHEATGVQKKMQAGMLQFIWLTTIEGHAVIPATETQVQEMHDKVIQNVLAVLGYQPEPENKSVGV